jgi:16S rRNA (guanine966-N2)-methyltransferase
MRIIGGTAAGRLLKVPKGYDVRPTPDLVRQAIFNSLGERVVGARVLELFAGTGALSLECLSRGAVRAVCVEKSERHAGFLRSNFADAGLAHSLEGPAQQREVVSGTPHPSFGHPPPSSDEGRGQGEESPHPSDRSDKRGSPASTCEVRVQDAFTAVAQLAAPGAQFDLILADPPYGEKNIGRRSTSFAQQLLDDVNLPLLLAPDGLFILGHTKRDTLDLPDVWHDHKILKHGDTVMRFLRKRVGGVME